MRQLLYRIHWFLERWITPGVECTQKAYALTVKSNVTPTTRWLDLGCGHQLWADWVGGQEATATTAALVVGLDPDVASLRQNTIVDYRVAGLELPFRDGTFTLITANMVFEHLEDPIAVLKEIRRVLADQGICIFHTPNRRYWQIVAGRHLPQKVKHLLIRYSQQRDEADVYRTHYRINTEAEILRVARAAGFEADQIQLLNASAANRILMFGPFVILDLLWTRLTQSERLRQHRSNIVAVIRTTKPRAS